MKQTFGENSDPGIPLRAVIHALCNYDIHLAVKWLRKFHKPVGWEFGDSERFVG